MLEGMQQPASPETSSPSSTFAGLLATLSARPPGGAERQPTWSDDGLADDVATLSYERALRAHARYRAPETGDQALTRPADAGTGGENEAIPAEACPAAPAGAQNAQSEAAREAAKAEGRNLKCSSITIRLSKAQGEELRQRAAEAGLTVSAYMRSCTFEAERLRELVRATLLQMRSERARESTEEPAHDRHGWRQWLGRWRPHGRGSAGPAGGAGLTTPLQAPGTSGTRFQAG
jgi:hypothetical protein